MATAGDFLGRLEKALTVYNREPLKGKSISKSSDDRLRSLKAKAAAAGLDPAILEPLNLAILPNMSKASRLAQKYQNLYQWCGVIAYLLSGAAVAIACYLWLYWKEKPVLFLLEAVDIVIVILLVRRPQFRDWQRRWLEYRYLSERLRVCCFRYVVGLRYEFYEPPPDQRIGWLGDTWVTGALQEAWRSLPAPPAISDADSERRKLANFLSTA